MKNIFVFFTLALFLGSFALATDPSQEETYFFKISKALRGTPPTMAERADYQNALAAGTGQAFLQAKVQDYLQSDRFSITLKQKVDELFRFSAQNTNYAAYPGANSAYNRFVRNLIQGNLSWDQLLLGKHYSYTSSSQLFSGGMDDDFYNVVSKNQIIPRDFGDIFAPFDQNRLVLDITFAPDDQRIAGAVTTPRFFGRYANTALNKNRRRAAAIFRIFLCDTMVPSVPPTDASGEDKDFATIFPDHNNYTEDQIRQNAQADVHGQLPDCKACHYKLDPLGQVFGFSAASLSPAPAPGALRYRGADGRNADIPLRGLGDMAATLVQQPEYASCQVRHFWNWYVGKDVPLSRNKENDLIKKFNDLGRKSQDFVAYLISLPEFRAKPEILTDDQLTARRVVKIFQNCNGCHQAQDKNQDIKAWDLTDLPYSADPAERQRDLDDIKKELDLDNGGANKKMPPKTSLWQLSTEDTALIKKWMDHGAPDFDGNPQITPIKVNP